MKIVVSTQNPREAANSLKWARKPRLGAMVLTVVLLSASFLSCLGPKRPNPAIDTEDGRSEQAPRNEPSVPEESPDADSDDVHAASSDDADSVTVVDEIQLVPQTEVVGPDTLLAAIEIIPPFPIGADHFWLGHGPCRPVQACTRLVIEDGQGNRMQVETAQELALRYPPTSLQEMANLVTFFLETPHAFTDVHCMEPPSDQGYYLVGETKDLEVEPIAARTVNGKTDLLVVEACWGNPDQLIRAAYSFDEEGTFERAIDAVLFEANFLPRYL